MSETPWPAPQVSTAAAVLVAMVWMLLVWPPMSLRCGADPIPAVDLDKCEPTYLFPRNKPGDCCPPKLGSESKPWKRENCSTVRVRRPCHRLQDWERERYNHAYHLIRDELRWDDPRSLYSSNNIHCSYCMNSLPLPWPDARLQIHFSWLFFPWHRWYIYFHERTLARLLGDDTFALCYWNWDNMVEAGAAQIPAPFVDEPALFDAHRSPRHQPPAIANLSYTYTPNTPIGPKENRPQENTAELVQANLALTHQAVVEAATRDGFFGGAYRTGQGNVPFFSPMEGSVEGNLHNTVHLWTGNEFEEDDVDMGSFWAAASDPIFYTHHTQIDRLWNVWKGLGEWRADIQDPDYLDTEFNFYDEDGEYVRVNVADSLASSQLCYDYEHVPEADALWINYQSSVCSKQIDTPQKKQQWLQTIPEYELQFGQGLRVLSVSAANSPFTTRIKRPQHKPPPPSPGVEFVEVLVFENVSMHWEKTASAMVFVHLDANEGQHVDSSAVTCAEFLAMFSNMPRSLPAGHAASYHWGLDRKLAQLDAAGLEDVAVTIVAGEQHTSHNPINIGSIRIQYEPR